MRTKLFIVSTSLSAASTNASKSAEAMPCCSGLLCGSVFCAHETGARSKQRRRTTLAWLRRFIRICVICGLVGQIDCESRNDQPEEALHEEEQKAPEAYAFDPDRGSHI